MPTSKHFDVVVTIDDDNLLCDTDYLGRHAHVGQHTTVNAVHSESGWWNVCEMLQEARDLPFYHRGHPLEQRWKEDAEYRTISPATGRVVVNAGLWLDDPDIDALTRLYAPIRVTGRKPTFEGSNRVRDRNLGSLQFAEHCPRARCDPCLLLVPALWPLR